MTNEELEQQFTNIIREKLTDDQFWEWVRGWKDEEVLCEEAEDWFMNSLDKENKEYEIEELKRILNS